MNDRHPESPLPPSQPIARTAAPRTLVNSSATAPYVPAKSAPVRAGADDHKLHTSKGRPT